MRPTYDEEFLRLVRLHLEPALLDAGFVFNEVTVGLGSVSAPLVRDSAWGQLYRRLLLRGQGNTSPTGMTTTTVLYEADAQEFAAAYPRSQERPEEPDCKDLWLYYDSSTRSVDFDLQGEHVELGDAACLLNDACRSLEERVVALSGAVKQFLAEASASR